MNIEVRWSFDPAVEASPITARAREIVWRVVAARIEAETNRTNATAQAFAEVLQSALEEILERPLPESVEFQAVMFAEFAEFGAIAVAAIARGVERAGGEAPSSREVLDMMEQQMQRLRVRQRLRIVPTSPGE